MNDTANTRRKSTAAELIAARRNPAQQSLPIEPAPQKATGTEVVPAKPALTLEQQYDKEYRNRYLDEVAPASIVGRMVKFSKEGQFVTSDDGQAIPETSEFTVLADETLIGWVKFNGEGEPPSREMGLLFDGWVMPARERLGDLDKTKWEMGLDGQPADPWQHRVEHSWRSRDGASSEIP